MPVKKKRILVACQEAGYLVEILTKERFFAYSINEGKQVLNMVYNEPPDLIIIDSTLKDISGKEIIRDIKRDNIYAHLPIILLASGETFEKNHEWEYLPVDDYLVKPVDERELLLRVSLAFFKSTINLDSNPLTRLPGNISIMSDIQKRLDNSNIFSLSYVDVDNFKPFNDRYGFVRGDEVLRMLSRLITSVVLDLKEPDSFIGHIGGDDFVFIVSPSRVDEACIHILKNFNIIIQTFYDEEDRVRGFIESKNREGKQMNFPVMSLSMAVVSNENRTLDHFGQISSIAAEIKKVIKAGGGNSYLKDQRTEKNR